MKFKPWASTGVVFGLVALFALASLPGHSGVSYGQTAPGGSPWSTKAATDPGCALGAANVQGKISVVYGWSSGPHNAYDPSSDTWDWRQTPPTRRYGHAVVSLNDVLFVIGGRNGEGAVVHSNAVESLNPGTTTWQKLASLPTARISPFAAFVGGKIYAIGGETPDGMTGVVEEYDPGSNTWATKAPMPTPRGYGGAAVVNDKIYVVGGFIRTGINITPSPLVDEYDPATDTWRSRSPLNIARGSLAVAVSGGRVYAFGGQTPQSGSLPTVEEYDPPSNTWRPRTNMPTKRSGLAAATANDGSIYVVGGCDSYYGSGFGGPFSGANERYRPEQDTFATATPTSTSTATATGTATATATATQTPTPTGPDYGLSVNTGAIFTNQVTVTLSLPARTSTTQMQLSNDGGFFGAQWEPYSATKTWQITQFGNSIIPRTVYVKYRDAALNVFGPYQDDIILDVTAPTGSANLSAQTLALSASDDVSGIGGMKIAPSSDMIAAATWQPFSVSVAWPSSAAFVRFRDNAGNESVTIKATGGASETPTVAPPVMTNRQYQPLAQR